MIGLSFGDIHLAINDVNVLLAALLTKDIELVESGDARRPLRLPR